MRVTRKFLQSRLDYLNSLFGFVQGGPIVLELDYHQPGGNTHTWKVVVGSKRDMANGKFYYLEGQSAGPSCRMTASECEIMLNGLIWGVEHAVKRGDYAYQLEQK